MVERVWAVSREGDLVEYARPACGFAYRRSIFLNSDAVVVRAQIRCVLSTWPLIRKEMLSILRSRRQKFPLKQPNCGSVFMSDPSHFGSAGPPGRIIENCSLKGARIGDAMVSPLHANFIVNLGAATSEDVLRLIHHIRDTVRNRTGFSLSAEVRYITPQAHTMAAHLACSLEKQT